MRVGSWNGGGCGAGSISRLCWVSRGWRSRPVASGLEGEPAVPEGESPLVCGWGTWCASESPGTRRQFGYLVYWQTEGAFEVSRWRPCLV